MNEVYAPDVIGMLRSEPGDRTAFVIKTLTLLVALGKLQTVLTPDAFHLLVCCTASNSIANAGSD